MLKLHSLTMQDFGPFKGVQEINFPESGVLIIYGDNGRGKTTLLNALRYALFGRVLGRGSAPNELALLANTEACVGKPPEFKVALNFSSDGNLYKLTRGYGQGTKIAGEHLSLIENTRALGPDERHAKLSMLLPEEISRFFLFDGELLQQYEELLKDDSEAGEKLKRAIEKILGMPILTNARSDIAYVHSEFTKQIGKVAQTNERTRQIGEGLSDAQTTLDLHQRNILQLSAKRDKLEQEKQDLEARLAGTGKTQRLMGQREQMVRQRSEIRIREEELRDCLKELSKNAWKAPIQKVLADSVQELHDKIASLEQRRRESIYSEGLRIQIEKAAKTKECPTCHQGVSEQSQRLLLEVLREGTSERLEDLDTLIYSYKNKQGRLAAIAEPQTVASILETENQLFDIRIKLADLDLEISELEEQLKNVSEAELRTLTTTYANTQTILHNTTVRLREEQHNVPIVENTIHRLQKELSKLSGESHSQIDLKHQALGKLQVLFEAAIELHRSRLKRNVESHATTIFCKLGREPEYTSLSINDHYGLRIIHKDGTPIVARSAGFEHIVSLSLIAALQRSAPIKGPIIVDSPFGRLDSEHRQRVLESLPEMADQVVLLVYEAELDRDRAIATLGDSLKGEIMLERHSARHTTIERRL